MEGKKMKEKWNQQKKGYKNERWDYSQIPEIHQKIHNSVNVNRTETTYVIMNEYTKILRIEYTG